MTSRGNAEEQSDDPAGEITRSGIGGSVPPKKAWRNYFTRPLLTILFLGFSSGLPLALTAATLSAWLFQAHVDKVSIGLFAAVGLPYTLKFLWSPVMDGVSLPLLSRLLGRRRSWILVTQLCLMASLIWLAFTHPESNPWMTALAALFAAFASASQDIVIDAYRVERLTPEEQGQGAAMTQFGYRLGMLAASWGALHLVAPLGWQGVYLVMAAAVMVGVITTLLAKEPPVPERLAAAASHDASGWLQEFVIDPFKDFMRHKSWLLIFVFIVVYKLADAFIGIMTNPFFLDIGFTTDQIANIVKAYGLIATLLGLAAGGILTARFGVMRILFVVGLLHALTNLLYVAQVHMGANAILLGVSIALENFTGAVSSIAFVAYLSSLCNVHYTATQYALLSSLAGFGRVWLATPAGIAAKYLGWAGFFTFAAALAAPGLILLWVLNKRLERHCEA